MTRKQIHTLVPVLMDRMTYGNALNGAEVQAVQPFGCPKNGMMGMTYIQHLDGRFIGLVCKASLVKTGRTAPVRKETDPCDECGEPAGACDRECSGHVES